MGYRLDKGGHIDRSQAIQIRWNGRRISAFAGDTIASALLANDIPVVGRSMKLHRPRGVLSAGPEEPNALVTLGRGAELEPIVRFGQYIDASTDVLVEEFPGREGGPSVPDPS